jgi:hypothetical protein
VVTAGNSAAPAQKAAGTNAWLGPPYTPSGFALTASLPPGAYTLAVYARSTATGYFRNVRTVEIVVQ